MSLADIAARIGRHSSGQPPSVLRRSDIFIWAAVILFVNQLVSIIGPRSASPEALGADAAAVGTFQYMAWYAVFRLLRASNSTSAARWRDLVVVAGLCLLVFLPTSRMIWVSATGLSIYLGIVNSSDNKIRAAAIVIAALSIQEFWGHVFFNLVAFPVLRAEAAVVGIILGAVRPGTEWYANIITGPSGYGIIVYTGCSSFHNVSLAMLCWVTVSRLRHQNWRRRDLVIGGAIVGIMVLLNVARLCLMAWDNAFFDYWHEGIGAEIFAISASLTILVISLYGVRPTKRLE